jgi:hypothetical protein
LLAPAAGTAVTHPAFKTPRDIEVCRIANFCTQHVELRGVEAYEIDGGAF